MMMVLIKKIVTTITTVIIKATEVIRTMKVTIMIIAFDQKANASLISFLRPVSFELVCLCTAMQNFSRSL